MNMLLYLAAGLAAAAISRKIAKRLSLPVITGYILIGIALGVSFLNILKPEVLSRLGLVSDIAMSLIAFTIGAELNLKKFSNLGKSILFIAIGESFGAFLLVSGILIAINPSKPAHALILGSIASATAPAATVLVLNEIKAKGKLTNTILAVVGFDDAISLILFSFAATVTKVLFVGMENFSLTWTVLHPLIEIGGALILGVILGLAGGFVLSRFRGRDDSLMIIGAFILFGSGLSRTFNLSQLLTNMALGMVLINTFPNLKPKIISANNSIGPLLYALFFIYAGALLNIKLFTSVMYVGLIYFTARFAGKVGGSYIGARLGSASEEVRKYIGFSLIPQVGVSIALAILVQRTFGEGDFGVEGVNLASVVVNVLLLTTVLTEIVGPLLTRWSIIQAGESRLKTKIPGK